MPVVLADTEGRDEQVQIVFPLRDVDAPGGWRWDEVAVAASAIEGYGLYVPSRLK